MIAKRIDRKGGDYRACALYIAGAAKGVRPEEKVWAKWYAGGQAEDYQEGLLEVKLTQALNTRSKRTKTYHLVASFHPEDEDKLTREVFADIESALAAALGLAGHQRHCGVHRDTGHIHLHVAYNLIDPETLRHRDPYYDFPKLSQACRVLERKYGLRVDKGMETSRSAARTPPAPGRAKNMEARSGQESLFSFIQRRQADLEKELAAAADWAEVQTAFLKRGLRLRLSGNGLAVQERFGPQAVKASGVSREWSKARLEKRFGPFVALSPEAEKAVPAETIYAAAPLTTESGELFRHFQEASARRKAALEEVEQAGRLGFTAWREKWRRKRQELKRLPMLKADRQRLWRELRERELAELAALRAETAARRKAARAAHPPTSWKKFKAQAARNQVPAVEETENKHQGHIWIMR